MVSYYPPAQNTELLNDISTSNYFYNCLACQQQIILRHQAIYTTVHPLPGHRLTRVLLLQRGLTPGCDVCLWGRFSHSLTFFDMQRWCRSYV